MRKTVPVLLIMAMVLAGCGSSLNPLNWFGRGRDAAPSAANTNPLIPTRAGGGLFGTRPSQQAYAGTRVDQVTSLVVERIPGGAIVRVTGIASRHGAHEVRLVPETANEAPIDGVLSYELMAIQPGSRIPPGTPQSRELRAARHLTDQDLIGVRSIRVSGLRNAQVSRR